MSSGKGISCNDFRDSLGDWLDGLAPAKLREGMNSHLGDCPDCRSALERERLFHSLLGSLERDPAPAGFATRALDLILPEQAPVPLWSPGRWAPRLLAAAMLLLLVGALAQWFSPVGGELGPELLKDTAATALVESSREVPGFLQFVETSAERVQQITGPALNKMESLLRAERTVRGLIPSGALALFLLVSLTPLVLLFTVYRLRIKGALSHVLVVPSLR